jgi:hypothetical protein
LLIPVSPSTSKRKKLRTIKFYDCGGLKFFSAVSTKDMIKPLLMEPDFFMDQLKQKRDKPGNAY